MALAKNVIFVALYMRIITLSRMLPIQTELCF